MQDRLIRGQISSEHVSICRVHPEVNASCTWILNRRASLDGRPPESRNLFEARKRKSSVPQVFSLELTEIHFLREYAVVNLPTASWYFRYCTFHARYFWGHKLRYFQIDNNWNPTRLKNCHRAAKHCTKSNFLTGRFAYHSRSRHKTI